MIPDAYLQIPDKGNCNEFPIQCSTTVERIGCVHRNTNHNLFFCRGRITLVPSMAIGSLRLLVALLASVALAKSRSLPRKGSLPLLLDASLDELANGLAQGAFTSVDLVTAYIARIHEVNEQLHAVTELNPDALAIAQTLDDARQGGRVLGSLHGIPVLLKNNIATADRMNTTAGSYALLGARVPEDSTVARKLRNAGAILLGKANLSQWSDARGLNASNGWSAHGGQTYAAYHPDQDPCGSSSGSGVAASLGLAWAALGTETSGSLQCPASFNNVVAIKPTVGLSSRYLVVPISEHQDTVGPLARSVKDAAHLLSAIAGQDDHDNYTSAIPFDSITKPLPDYVAACQPSALQGKRIGVPRHIMNGSGHGDGSSTGAKTVAAAFNSSLDVMRSAGATIVDDIFLDGWEQLTHGRHMRMILVADLLTDVPRYLAKLSFNPHNLTTLEDVRDFTRSHPQENFPTTDTGIFDGTLNVNMTNTSPLFWSNRTTALHLAGELGILGAMANHSLDAIVLPTDYAHYHAAVLGTPVVVVPMGVYPPATPITRSEYGNLVQVGPNIPFGISFMGRHFSEEALIGMGYAFEQLTMVRDTIKPYLQPKTELLNVVASSDGASAGEL
ncbi:amidase [Coniella lustricola]|uniref:Amidase n=1 Tax=Coniella lustricola TaxID=2025994 RepID=A0A2T3AAH0_9PEZI|nr:amidase [Coniella lustricola]